MLNKSHAGLACAMTVMLAATLPSAAEDTKRAKKAAERVPVHTPEWTDLNSGDPGTSDSVVPELSEIVVLCATSDPDSKEFEKAWERWLKTN